MKILWECITIKDIKVNKNRVILTFNDDSKLDVSHHAYTEFYLYVGKSLSKQEIQKIKDLTDLNDGLNYALSFLKKSIYTESTIRGKLIKKDYSKNIIDSIIKFLKNNDLINDKAYIQDYLEYSNETLIGKNKILQDLKNKGINEIDLKRIKFSISKETKKANALLPSLEKKYCSYNQESKKKHIYDALIRKGFDLEIANSVIKNININTEQDEFKKLEKDFNKLIISLKRKELEPKEIKNKVFESLKRKGYKTKDINKIMEEYYEIN